MNPDHEVYREKHRDQLHDLLKKSYETVEGGYSGLGSGSKAESDAIHNDISHSMIKAVKRGDTITATMLYKDRYGRKAIAAGTDGSIQGKKNYRAISKDDKTQERAWSEVSGRPEDIARKAGVAVVPSSMAAKLTGKDVEPVTDEKYRRKISNDYHEKTIMGYPKGI
jgi:hypothetical protein